jgi:hypothetical protein
VPCIALNVIFYYMYSSCCQHAAKKFLDMDFVVIIAVLPWYIICTSEIIGALFLFLIMIMTLGL